MRYFSAFYLSALRHSARRDRLSAGCKKAAQLSRAALILQTVAGLPAGIGSVLDEHAQARTGERGSLARHRPAQALTLESGREVAFAAGEEAGKEFH
jgi:hypothetical protein